jgi:hypothetical protein
MKFAQLIPTSEMLISDATVAALKPEKPIEVDPQDIPERVLAKMTPTLENEESKDDKDKFPEFYVPDTLKGLMVSNESVDFHTQLSDQTLQYLTETIEQLSNVDQMSPLMVRSVKHQLSNIQDTLGVKTSSVVEYLDKVLTSDGPYNHQVTMENLRKVSASLKTLLLRSLTIPVTTYKKLESIGSTITPENLKLAIESIQRSRRLGPNDQSPIDASIDINQIFPKIVEAVDKGYDIDDVKDHVLQTTSRESNLSTVAVTAIVNALRKIPLQTSRYVTSKDFATVKVFMEKAIAVQELETQLLTQISTSIGTGQGGSEAALNTTKIISDAVSQFFAGCVKLADNNPSTMTDSAPSYVYNVFTSGKKVILQADGTSASPVTYGQSSYAMFKPSQVHDIYDAYINTLTTMLKNLKEVNKKNAQIANSIIAKLNDPNNQESTADSVVGEAFAAGMAKCSKALKFSSLMAITGISFCEDVEYCIREMCRGMSIISES